MDLYQYISMPIGRYREAGLASIYRKGLAVSADCDINTRTSLDWPCQWMSTRSR
jgi:hypothetical protein